MGVFIETFTNISKAAKCSEWVGKIQFFFLELCFYVGARMNREWWKNKILTMVPIMIIVIKEKKWKYMGF